MKTITIFAVLAALVICGCGNKEEAGTDTQAPTTSTAAPTLKAVSYEKGSKKVGDMGVCAICMINAGKETEEEEAKAVLDYKERTYVFCNQAEEAEFISNPKKYAGE